MNAQIEYQGITAEDNSDIIKSLRQYNPSNDIDKYLNNKGLRFKSAEEILNNFTFGNNIARAFRKQNPGNQYKKWASKNNGNEIVSQLKSVSTQAEYDSILLKYAESLVQSWEKFDINGNQTNMNIGVSLKIINLLMKHLTFVHLPSNKKVQSYLHVPWDKFTLTPIRKIWNGYPRIPKNPTQGFVKTREQYFDLLNFITELTKQANVNRIIYEFWSFDQLH